jgi:hypothetical protein
MSSSPSPFPVSVRPLAAALISMLGVADRVACAAPAVTNCNDAGPGSLRASVLAAAEDDTVDASQLQCSTISLTTGFIAVGQNSLKIIGPGADKLTIDGKDDPQYNIFFHAGNGDLEIDHLAMSNGYLYLNDPHKYLGGGCIFSAGNVKLNYTTVSFCEVYAAGLPARGGGVFAQGDLHLTHSVVTGNRADTKGGSYPTYGGGVFSNGFITLDNSTISYNNAYNGGGVRSNTEMIVLYSTISNNYSDTGAGIDCHCVLLIAGSTISGNGGFTSGGVYIQNPINGQPQPATIFNSTITGNRTTGFYAAGAVDSRVPLTITGSTIAFNMSSTYYKNSAVYAASGSLELENSIVAENFPADLAVHSGITLSGANNLIVSQFAPALPGTITACPQLEPLADNGGPTFTLALRSTSPAINAGANPLMLTSDQRGAGYPRVFGAKADIGAFEWQGVPGDHVFRNGFDAAAAFCDL